MLIVQIKKKIKWRDLDYLFNGIRVLLVCSLNIPEAAQDPKHTRRKYEKERRKDLRPQTPDPSGTFFINIFISIKTVGGSILVKINITLCTDILKNSIYRNNCGPGQRTERGRCDYRNIQPDTQSGKLSALNIPRMAHY